MIKSRILYVLTSLVCIAMMFAVHTDMVSASSVMGKTVIVDAGHGGYNPGAVANGSIEAENNLAVALLLADRLTEAGANVVMTRTSDRAVAQNKTTLQAELQARVTIAERNKGDIFVSIHSNSNDNQKIEGAMTFYHNDSSRALAEAVQKNLVYRTKANDKGVQMAGFYVIRHTSMPSVLVEMGFVTNPKEARRLTEAAYRERLADGIYEGIEEYFRS